MGRRLYVGNLPYSTGETELQDLFGTVGQVESVRVMRDAATGTSLMNFTGMRPGCLINVIPAAGVIVQVEASSGCTCYHAIQSTVAFVPPGAE